MRYIPKLQNGKTIVQQADATKTTPRLLYNKPIQKLNTPQDFARAAEQRGTTVTDSLINLSGKPTEKKGNYWDFWGGRLGTNLNQLGNLGMGVAKTVGASAALATGMAYTPATIGTLGTLGKGLLSGAVVDQGYSLLGGRPANVGEIGLGAGATMGMPLVGKGLVKGGKVLGEHLLEKSRPYLTGDKSIPMMSYKPKINFDSQLDLIDNQNIYPNMYNMSGTSKNQLVKNVSKEDRLKLHPLNEEEFFWTVTKPGGKFDRYKREGIDLEYINKMYKLRDANPISRDNYIEEFNKTVERLNEIISKNNKSGTEYISTGLTINEKGYPSLNFNSEYGPSNFRVHINPAKWDGKVEDISSKQYLELIPGISMVNTHKTVFGDGIPRINSGTYKSINEYLKEFNLGRVKSAVHLDNPQQSFDSRTLWEKAIIADKAVGFYADPYSIRGVMKSIIPAISTYGLTQNKKE